MTKNDLVQPGASAPLSPPLMPTAEDFKQHPKWHIAWLLSELVNDNAPIGWEKYISIADGAEFAARNIIQ